MANFVSNEVGDLILGPDIPASLSDQVVSLVGEGSMGLRPIDAGIGSRHPEQNLIRD